MSTERYVVLALAHPRSGWLGELAQWANSSSLPVDLVKCVSAEELRARLDSGRPFSAAMVDASLPSVDRDLLHGSAGTNCPVLVVDSPTRRRDWAALGAKAVLSNRLDRQSLMDALRQYAVRLASAESLPAGIDQTLPESEQGLLAAICSPGGTGASTVAIALAQGIATHYEKVVLADLCRHGEQAMLHDAGDVVPGLQELVEAHRTGRPSEPETIHLTFRVVDRGYDLLLGLRQPSAWTVVKPRAFEASLATLRHVYDVLVCDVDQDLEGERAAGSLDVEERNGMARTSTSQADVVFAVGSVGMKGVHSLGRVIGQLLDHGVGPGRIIPVFNRAPRSPRLRSELVRALAGLIEHNVAVASSGRRMPSAIFVPERRVDDALRDGVRLPEAIAAPLTGAFRAVAEARHGPHRQVAAGEKVQPGSVGHWPDGPGEEASGRALRGRAQLRNLGGKAGTGAGTEAARG